MSRIGRNPVEIPKGVQVSITKDAISTKGPKGTLSMKRHAAIEIKQAKNDEGKDVVVFERKSNEGAVRAAHGLMRALVNNMITGVTNGFTKTLEINGVGYKAELKKPKIILSLGYSHPIEYTLP
jgi:large subunit ribosomal protein L6